MSGSRVRGRVLRILFLMAAASGLAVGAPVPALAAASEAAAAQPSSAKVERPVKRFQLEAQKWSWTPDTIKVRKGTHVVLELYSRDASRAFELKGYDLNTALPEGDTVRVEFDADRVGTFPWRCSRPCGNGCAKLRGTLTVVE